jgi:catechol 2,3-dioxygenase-like lactoylglutathione lyase family enzyme
MLINYVLVGTNDIERARDFYDPLFAELGASRVVDLPHETIWGRPGEFPTFGTIVPFDGKAASFGNGTMVALGVPDRHTVDRLYDIALRLGAEDEGAPGVRGDDPEGFYGAYIRDLDGNKLCFSKFGKD